jgi:hypothetical protein
MKITEDKLLHIIAGASERFLAKIILAHKQNSLESFLKDFEMEDLLDEVFEEGHFESMPNGKLIVIGDSHISSDQIFSCFTQLRIPKERVELHVDYDKLKKLDVSKFQYQMGYRLIFAGPTPHSGVGKEDYSSILTRMEKDDGFPKVVRLSTASGLKITKTGLMNAIEKEVREGYIQI